MLLRIISQKILAKAKIIKYFYISLFLVIGIFLWPKTTLATTITAENIINLTNAERLKNDVNALVPNSLLEQAAYNKGRDIIKTQLFQHNINDKKFSAWIKDVGYEYSYVGENLALDFETSEGAIKAWLDSETHRKNLLNGSFQEIGVAIIRDKFQGNDTILIVQIFGTPAQPLLANSNSAATAISFKNKYQAAVKSSNNLTTTVQVLTANSINREQLPVNNFNQPSLTSMELTLPSMVLNDAFIPFTLNDAQLQQIINQPNQFLNINYQQQNRAAMARLSTNLSWNDFVNYNQNRNLASYYIFIALTISLLLFIYLYFNIALTKRNKLK